MCCFSHCSFKYRFKKCHNTRENVLVFICSYKSFKMSSEWTLHRPCFLFFFYRSTTDRMNYLPSLFLFFFSLQFQIVSNALRRHHVASLFSFFCSSISFQIPLESTIYRPCFHIFLCSSKPFQTPSVFTVYRLCFQKFLCSFKSFQGAPLPSVF